MFLYLSPSRCSSAQCCVWQIDLQPLFPSLIHLAVHPLSHKPTRSHAWYCSLAPQTPHCVLWTRRLMHAQGRKLPPEASRVLQFQMPPFNKKYIFHPPPSSPALTCLISNTDIIWSQLGWFMRLISFIYSHVIVIDFTFCSRLATWHWFIMEFKIPAQAR